MIPLVTVTQKPVSPGRARYMPLTPLRRECRCFGFICGDYTCVLSTNARKAAGAAKHPAFPAPSALPGRSKTRTDHVAGMRSYVPKLSSPAKAGDPVRCALSTGAQAFLDYWMPPYSRGMTMEQV